MRLRQLELTREQFDIIVRGTEFNEITKEMLWEYLSTQEEVTQKEVAEAYGLTQPRLNHCMKRFGIHLKRIMKQKKLTYITLFVEEKDLPEAKALDGLTRYATKRKRRQLDLLEEA